jgi:mycothiol synthase
MIVRRPTAADLPRVLALCQAADRSVYGDSDWTEADLRHEWEHEVDLDRDAWLVELDGTIAGYATFEDRDGRLIGDGYVDPTLRGRGVGSRLLELTEERAREASDGASAALESAFLDGDPAAPALFRAHGYEPVRHFLRMVIDLERPPEPSEPQDEITIAPFERSDARALHAAIEEAFAEEFGFRPEPFDRWAERRLEGPRARPDLWYVARDGDEIAGAIVCDWKRNGDWGWIGAVAVRTRWRRRGLGAALLRTAFGRFYELGERRVALGVDAANPTGAARLYERAGMRVIWRADLYRKDL